MQSRVEVKSSHGSERKGRAFGKTQQGDLGLPQRKSQKFGIYQCSIGTSDDAVPVLGFSYLLGLFIPLFVEGQEPNKHISTDVGTRL
jgi:hypothetical protein